MARLDIVAGMDLHGEGDKYIFWQGPRIGTCGEPIDYLCLSMGRTTSIPDIIVRYDGGRGGWSVGSSFRTPDGEDFMFREVVFIEDEEMDEDRFCGENAEVRHGAKDADLD